MPSSRRRPVPKRRGAPKEATPPLLSVCMIAKNEERLLDRALSSFKGLADEIVLVDTGSTDRTIEIALSHGARVFEIEWTNDFSAARNYGIERALGKWIFVADCDEEFSPDQAKKLRAVIRQAPDDVVCFTVNVQNAQALDDRQVVDATQSARVFRSAPNHRYVSPIHEQILPSLMADGRIVPSDCHLWHFGYLGEIVEEKNKIERNIRMLSEMLPRVHPEDPFRPYLLMQLGREFQRKLDQAQAHVYLSEAVAAMDRSDPSEPLQPYFHMLAIYFAENLNALQRHAEAAEFTGRTLERMPWNADLWFFLGVAELNLGKMAMGITHLLWATTVLTARRESQEFYSQSRSIHAWRNAALALMNMGAREAALQLILTALASAPEDSSLLTTAVELVRNSGVLQAVLVQKAEASTLRNILKGAFLLQDGASLQELATELLRQRPELSDLGHFWLGALSIMREDYEVAVPWLDAVTSEGDLGGWARLGLVAAHCGAGRRSEVVKQLEAAPHDLFHTLQREIAGVEPGTTPEHYDAYRRSFIPLLERWHILDAVPSGGD